MSYILDALRKADAQRERDPARGINAQSVPPTGENGARVAGPLMWAGITAAVVVVAMASWYALRPAAAPPAVVVAAPPLPMAPMVTPAPAPAPVPMQPPAPVQTAPMAPIVGVPPAGRTIPPRDPTNSSQPTMRAAQPVPGVIPVVPPSARAADAREAAMAARFGNRPGGAAVQPAQPVQTAPGMAPPPAAATAPAAAPAAAPATGLPPDAPKLAITGGVYSANAAQRMLIVNGQVFNEGSELAPGLTLERVTPKGAVVKFRGGSYTVAY